MIEDNKLTLFLKDLDLTDEEAAVLSILIRDGESTVFKLGAKTGVIRTTIYRALERLHKKGLVVYVPNEYRKTVKAAAFEDIQNIVEEKKAQVNSLIDTLPSIQDLFATKLDNYTDTKVYFYRGAGGIKQLQWNILSKSKDCYAFFSERYFKILDLVGVSYEKKWMKEFNLRPFVYKGIATNKYQTAMKKKDPELDNLFTKSLNIRIIPQKVLKITQEMRIYGDTLAFYNLDRDDVTGVEIVNKDITEMLKQMFDMYWGLAE